VPESKDDTTGGPLNGFISEMATSDERLASATKPLVHPGAVGSERPVDDVLLET
jgi:hypothetical protein